MDLNVKYEQEGIAEMNHDKYLDLERLTWILSFNKVATDGYRGVMHKIMYMTCIHTCRIPKV